MLKYKVRLIDIEQNSKRYVAEVEACTSNDAIKQVRLLCIGEWGLVDDGCQLRLRLKVLDIVEC